jgi:hypothetical protein
LCGSASTSRWRWLSKNLTGISLPVNADIPSDIQVHFVDEFDAHASPTGARGIGELGATGVAAAVANAVCDAVRIRIRDLPITPASALPANRRPRNPRPPARAGSFCGPKRPLPEMSGDRIRADGSDHTCACGEMLSGNALTVSHAGASRHRRMSSLQCWARSARHVTNTRAGETLAGVTGVSANWMSNTARLHPEFPAGFVTPAASTSTLIARFQW